MVVLAIVKEGPNAVREETVPKSRVCGSSNGAGRTGDSLETLVQCLVKLKKIATLFELLV